MAFGRSTNILYLLTNAVELFNYGFWWLMKGCSAWVGQLLFATSAHHSMKSIIIFHAADPRGVISMAVGFQLRVDRKAMHITTRNRTS